MSFFFFWKLPQILSGKRKRINKWVKVYPKLQRIDYSYILGNETLYSFSSGDNETIPYTTLSKLEFSESWLLSSLCLSWNISTCRNVGRIVSQIKPAWRHNIHIFLYIFETETYHRMPVVGCVLFRVVHMQNLSEPSGQTPSQIPWQGKKVVGDREELEEHPGEENF